MKMVKFSKKLFCSMQKWKPNIPDHVMMVDLDSFRAPHPIWNLKDAQNFKSEHYKPKNIRDKLALFLNKIFHKSCDIVSGYAWTPRQEKTYLRRITYLETFSAVPGMIGAVHRHFAALRYVREDGGWIHHLLEEAENARVHLSTVLTIVNPGLLERLFILFGQFTFILYYSTLYIISPSLAHRYVGYLNEEAIKIYSELIKDLDEGKLPQFQNFQIKSKEIQYWGLNQDDKLKDVFVSIRNDKIFHREYNHHFADIPKNFPIEAHKILTSQDKIEWRDQVKEEEKNKM